jgi:predicted NBD/HSP70 family sugar kinase
MLLKNSTINIPRILRVIWLNKGISRIEISRMLDLDKSTVTNIVSKLIDSGIIKKLAEGKSSPTGGRKPIFLSINNDFGCILGIEVMPDSYKASIINLEGEILQIKSGDLNINKDNFISQISDKINSIKKELMLPLIGVGIGLSGMIDSDRGIIFKSIPLGITEDFNFYEEISSKIDLPIFVENDANCCALGELLIHRDEIKNFLSILIEFRDKELIKKGKSGIAVGFGIVLNGKVYYGSNYSAGEFRSIFTESSSINQFSLTKDEIININNDREIFKKFIVELAKNVALFVNTLGLDHVFFGGFKSAYQEEVIPIFKKAIEENWSYASQINCEIKSLSFEDMVVAYGAGGMILEHLFSIPTASITPNQDQDARSYIIKNNIQNIIKMQNL